MKEIRPSCCGGPRAPAPSARPTCACRAPTTPSTCWPMGRERYSEAGPGDAAQRRSEALLAAAYVKDSPFAHIARMCLGAWADVDAGVLLKAMERIARREAGSNLALVGLIGMLY